MKKLIMLDMALGLLLVSAEIAYAQNFYEEWTKVYESNNGMRAIDNPKGVLSWEKEIDIYKKLIAKYLDPIKIGMTDKEVLKLTGRPLNINRSVGSWGVQEQWIIEMPPSFKKLYLYFKNGILASWQQ
jgi:hypothetical protein